MCLRQLFFSICFPYFLYQEIQELGQRYPSLFFSFLEEKAIGATQSNAHLGLPGLSGPIYHTSHNSHIQGALHIPGSLRKFLAAKISGIGVEEFSIGFGPKLFSFRRGETVYGLGIFPLGGYNKLVGMDPTEQLATEDAGYPQRDGKTPVGMDPTERLATERERLSFYNKPILHRAFTILFGPSMNYVFAVFLLTVFFMMGTYFLTLEIESIMPDSAAEAAGFQAGDKVVAVEGQEIKDWEELVRITQEHPGDRLSYVVERDGEQLTIEATVGKRGEVGFLGIGPRLVKKELDLFPAALSSLRASYNITRLYFHGVIRLV
ncbi:regulator of sigma E protease, partial [Candidatus Hakubella thermalkaliphila]